MKKKIIVLLLAMSMTASIVGCGGNATPSDSSISTTDTKEESVVVEPTEEDSTEVSESVDDNIIEENSELQMKKLNLLRMKKQKKLKKCYQIHSAIP